MRRLFCLTLLLAGALTGCGAPDTPVSPEAAPSGFPHAEHETLIADLRSAELAEGERLRVVATTSLVADTLRRVGGDAIEITVLLKAGADPHTYTATPQDMVALHDADAIFANGLNLEESLLPTLGAVQGPPIVSLNEGVTLIEAGGHAEEAGAAESHAHGRYDPHTWQSVASVAQWATNVATALSALDPARAGEYSADAKTYRAELSQLDAEVRAILAPVPAGRRKLVTDHDTFAYFARDYDFTVVGSVIPSFSSLASISAQDLAALQEQIGQEGAPVVFVGSTVNPRLAEQIAADMQLPVVPLYSDALGAEGTSGASYVGMMRTNAQAIAAALQ